eukprot:jgi/Bigna1/62686/fgenesh1_kg.40_\
MCHARATLLCPLQVVHHWSTSPDQALPMRVVGVERRGQPAGCGSSVHSGVVEVKQMLGG